MIIVNEILKYKRNDNMMAVTINMTAKPSKIGYTILAKLTKNNQRSEFE